VPLDNDHTIVSSPFIRHASPTTRFPAGVPSLVYTQFWVAFVVLDGQVVVLNYVEEIWQLCLKEGSGERKLRIEY
jgi:hypothetical protein